MPDNVEADTFVYPAASAEPTEQIQPSKSKSEEDPAYRVQTDELYVTIRHSDQKVAGQLGHSRSIDLPKKIAMQSKMLMTMVCSKLFTILAGWCMRLRGRRGRGVPIITVFN
jgi:hypothetical protein